MNTIHEHVELPDAADQPLVHPLDLPEARRAYTISWWVGQLAHPNIFFALAATFWVIHNNYITPIIVAAVITISAVLASKFHDREAWSFIPGKRQDTQRPTPKTWIALQAMITSGAMLFGLIMIQGWIIARGFPPEVGAVTAGIMIGIAVIMAVTMLWNLAVPARLRTDPAGRLSQLGTALVLIAAAIYASIALPETALVEGWQAEHIVMGTAMIVGIQIVLSLISRIPFRKTT